MAPVAASPTPIVSPLPGTVSTKDKHTTSRKHLEAVYTVVRDDLLTDFRRRNMPGESIEYYRRVRIPHMSLFYLLPRCTDRPDSAWTTMSQVENSTGV
jgi:hypothetical protein